MILKSYHLPPQASIPLTSPNPTENPNSLQRILINSSVNLGSGLITTTAPPPPPPLPVISNSGLLFREKISYLKSLKIDTTKVLEKNPNFRSASLDTVKSVRNFLSFVGVRPAAHGRIFGICPDLLTRDTTDLYPVYEFLLDDVGLKYSDVQRAIRLCPRLLVCSVEDQLKPTLWFLRKLGFNRMPWRTTYLLVSDINNTMMHKLDFLMGVGFRYDEVAYMMVRSPGLLSFSVENNLKPKLKYFLKEMNGDLRDLKRFPQYFNFSFKGRIVPRHQLLVSQGFSMPLKEMLEISDGEFNVRLIDLKLQLLDKL